MDEECDLPKNDRAIGARNTIDDGAFDLTEFENNIQPKSDISDRSELIKRAIEELDDEQSAVDGSSSDLFAFDENAPSSSNSGSSPASASTSSADDANDSSSDGGIVPPPMAALPAIVASAAAAGGMTKDSVKHIRNCQEIKERIKDLMKQERISGNEYDMKRIEADPDYAANVNQSLHDIFERENRCDSVTNLLIGFYRGVEALCNGGERKILGRSMPNMNGLGDEFEAGASSRTFKNKAGVVVDFVSDKLGGDLLDALSTVSMLGMPFVKTYQNNLKRKAGENVISSNSDISDLEEDTVW